MQLLKRYISWASLAHLYLPGWQAFCLIKSNVMSPMPQQTQNTFPHSLWHSSPLSIPLVSTVARLQILKRIYSFNSFVLFFVIFFCFFAVVSSFFFFPFFFFGGGGGGGGANMFSSESMPHFQFHCCVLHSSPATKVSSADLVLYCADRTPQACCLLNLLCTIETCPFRVAPKAQEAFTASLFHRINTITRQAAGVLERQPQLSLQCSKEVAGMGGKGGARGGRVGGGEERRDS